MFSGWKADTQLAESMAGPHALWRSFGIHADAQESQGGCQRTWFRTMCRSEAWTLRTVRAQASIEADRRLSQLGGAAICVGDSALD